MSYAFANNCSHFIGYFRVRTELHAWYEHAGIMNMTDMNPAGMDLMNVASGTSVNPDSWPMPMIMTHLGSWNTMFMGDAFLVDTQQSGPRGGDKLYSTNWFMASAEHRAGKNGAFQMDLMLSLEPATITDRRYPLLFQTGETAFGQAIVDGQHPHNFIMGLGFHYVRELGGEHHARSLFRPGGRPGAWAGGLSPSRIGRGVAGGAPIASLAGFHAHLRRCGHGWAGYKKVKLEASGFHGAEPGENRWIIQQGAIDSWSSRLWFFPAKNWAAQVSVGRLDASRSAGAGRSGAQHGVTRVHQADAGRKLGVELDLGTESRHSDGPQREFVPGRIGAADSAARIF